MRPEAVTPCSTPAIEQVIAHLVMTHDDMGERLDLLDVVIQRLEEGVGLAGEDCGESTH